MITSHSKIEHLTVLRKESEKKKKKSVKGRKMMTMMGMIVTNDDKRYCEVIKKIKIIMIMIKDIGRLLKR